MEPCKVKVPGVVVEPIVLMEEAPEPKVLVVFMPVARVVLPEDVRVVKAPEPAVPAPIETKFATPASVTDQLLSVIETPVAITSPMVIVLACVLLPMAMVLTAAPVLPILIISAEASVPMLIVPVVPELRVKTEAAPEAIVKAPASAMLLAEKVWVEPLMIAPLIVLVVVAAEIAPA